MTPLIIAVVAAAAWVTAVVLHSRSRRDLAFVGLPPGLVPPPGAPVTTATVTADPVVAVRFTPPDTLGVSEVGALWSKSLRARDVTAMIVDLAARGHLRIEALPVSRGGNADWKLVATPATPSQPLRDYEAALLVHLFGKRPTVRLSTLRIPFATGHRDVLALVDGTLQAQGLLAHPLAKRPRLAQRTALGRAYHEQARSFELYLATAQPHQLPDDALATAFSRYLPYAIVFNLTDRWVALFAELTASRQGAAGDGTGFDGVGLTPDWFVGAELAGSGFLGDALTSFSESIDSFTLAMSDWYSGSGDGSGDGGYSDGGGDGGGGDGGGGGD